MNYDTLMGHLHAVSGRAHVREYGRVHRNGRDYPLLTVSTPGKTTLLLTSGFHGEEPAGPRTIALHLPELLAEAQALDVGLRIYPCINPSGFDMGKRYGATHGPNNDFMRYVGLQGEEILLLRPGQPFSGVRLAEGLPEESLAVRADLERLPPPDAALDIHQDDYLHESCYYVYVFGERAAYRPALQASSALMTPLANTEVDSGYAPGEGLCSDDEACIEFQDGSITDWLRHRGTPFCAALETTTATPFELSDQVNWLWIRHFIRLAARGEGPASA